MFQPAATIGEVIASLEQIISDSIKNNTRFGYFATLYLKVTQAVQQGIEHGQFQNNSRMEQLDVTFANRYLNAYYLWQNNQQPTQSWKLAFEALEKSSVLILEHLLLGMSAHINLDLGIATVQTVGAGPLEDIHVDYNIMNDIIGGLTYSVLAELDKVSPLLSLLGLHAGDSDSVLIQFSIVNARDGAWCFAEELYGKTGSALDKVIQERDNNIFTLGNSLVHQKGLIAFTIWLIHVFEKKSPRKVIEILSGVKKTHFTIGRNLN